MALARCMMGDLSSRIEDRETIQRLAKRKTQPREMKGGGFFIPDLASLLGFGDETVLFYCEARLEGRPEAGKQTEIPECLVFLTLQSLCKLLLAKPEDH